MLPLEFSGTVDLQVSPALVADTELGLKILYSFFLACLYTVYPWYPGRLERNDAPGAAMGSGN